MDRRTILALDHAVCLMHQIREDPVNHSGVPLAPATRLPLLSLDQQQVSFIPFFVVIGLLNAALFFLPRGVLL